MAQSIAVQAKARSCGAGEVAEGGSDPRSARCATLRHVRSLPVITLARATMSNEVTVTGSGVGG